MSFTIDEWNYNQKTMIQNFIQHMMKKTLLLLKDLLKNEFTKI